MRKEIWLLCLPLLLLGGCGTQEKAQDPPQIITRKTVQEAKKAETPPEAKETPAPAETPEPAPQIQGLQKSLSIKKPPKLLPACF